MSWNRTTPSTDKPGGRWDMFTALRYPYFRLYWIGQFTSVLGQNMQQVATYWLVLQITNSPLMIALTGLCNAIPTIAFTFVGGALADRTDRKKLLAITQVIQALLYFSIATLAITDLVEVWHILVFAFLSGIARAFDQPTRQAMLPHLIPREDMAYGVALSGTVWQLSRLTGPAITGVIIAATSAATAFCVGGFGFVIFLVLLFFIRLDAPPLAARTKGLLGEVVEGLSFIRRNEIFYTLILMTFFNSVFGSSYTVLMPVIARDILQVGSQGYGFLQSAGGAGALSGTLLVAYLARSRKRGWHAILGATSFGCLLIALASSTWYPLSLVIMVLIGVANQFYQTSINTTLQMQLPDEFRGRVMGIYGLTWSLTPLGGTISGTIAEFAGVPFAIGLGGFLVANMALSVAAFLPRVRNLQ